MPRLLNFPGKATSPSDSRGLGQGVGLGQTWCTAHKTTTHGDAECLHTCQGLRAHKLAVRTRHVQ